MPTPATPPRCRHLHTDGRQCGSPALRAQPLCYQHDPLRRPLPTRTLAGRAVPQLPAPDDFLAIQRGIGDILRLLAHDDLTDRRAATLLRGYALASANLARHLRHEQREALRHHAAGTSSEPVTDCVNHPELGTLALPETPETQPEITGDTPIPIQQNQDLTPESESCDDPNTDPNTHLETSHQADRETTAPHPQETAAPHPQPRFTPLAEDTSYQDELSVGEMFLRLDESFRDKRRAFIHEKTAELEAEYQARFEATLETRLETRLQARLADNPHLPQPQPQPTQPHLPQ